MTTTTPTTGGFVDIPAAEYHAHTACSSSTLRKLAKGLTPCHVRHEQKVGVISTPSMTRGSALHAAVLEPDTFPERYALCEVRRDARTEAYKAWLEEHPGAEALSASEWEQVQGMAEAVRGSGEGRAMLRGGHFEESVFWSEGRLACKARLDAWGDAYGPTIWDIKTVARGAGPDQWARTLANEQYGVQAIHYMRALAHALGVDWATVDFRWLVVECDPPYLGSSYRLDPDWLDYSYERWREAIESWATAEETGVYLGYQQGIQMLRQPAWQRPVQEIDTIPPDEEF